MKLKSNFKGSISLIFYKVYIESYTYKILKKMIGTIGTLCRKQERLFGELNVLSNNFLSLAWVSSHAMPGLNFPGSPIINAVTGLTLTSILSGLPLSSSTETSRHDLQNQNQNISDHIFQSEAFFCLVPLSVLEAVSCKGRSWCLTVLEISRMESRKSSVVSSIGFSYFSIASTEACENIGTSEDEGLPLL